MFTDFFAVHLFLHLTSSFSVWLHFSWRVSLAVPSRRVYRQPTLLCSTCLKTPLFYPTLECGVRCLWNSGFAVSFFERLEDVFHCVGLSLKRSAVSRGCGACVVFIQCSLFRVLRLPQAEGSCPLPLLENSHRLSSNTSFPLPPQFPALGAPKCWTFLTPASASPLSSHFSSLYLSMLHPGHGPLIQFFKSSGSAN